MWKPPDESWKYEILKKEFPDLSDEDQEKMKDFLDDYAELILGVRDRMEADGGLEKMLDQEKNKGKD